VVRDARRALADLTLKEKQVVVARLRLTPVEDALGQVRRAMSFLSGDDQRLAIEKLAGWIAAEEASHLPLTEVDN
jgi:hypothetical protein